MEPVPHVRSDDFLMATDSHETGLVERPVP